ncbi:MAG: hypothetical protein GY754_19260 [bacterium]|nr:hypothetical protein [bacterium]
MKFVKMAAICGLLLLISCSVLSKRLERQAAERASFDFNCPKEKIKATQLGGTSSFGVRGCGKRATYVLGNSGWVLNSPITKDI